MSRNRGEQIIYETPVWDSNGVIVVNPTVATGDVKYWNGAAWVNPATAPTSSGGMIQFTISSAENDVSDHELKVKLEDVTGGEWNWIIVEFELGIANVSNIPTTAQISDSVWDETSTGHIDAGKAGQQLWTDVDAVLADTDELQTDNVPTLIAAIPTADENADAVWDEDLTGHPAVDSAGEQLYTLETDTADAVWDETLAAHSGVGSTAEKLDSLCCLIGSGSTLETYTVTDSGTGLPIQGVVVTVTTDLPGSNTVAIATTDAFGVVEFWLDPGTYYMWSFKAGYSFTNPDTEVVV